MAGTHANRTVRIFLRLLAAASVVALCLLPAGQGRPEKPRPDERPKAEGRKPDADLHGDPLPDGAVARLGTTRFRAGSSVSNLAWTPDGRSLLTLSWGLPDGVRYWDTATGRQVRQIKEKIYQSFHLSPDGKTLVLGAWTEALVVDAATGQHRKRFAVREGTELVALSPDGKTVACWSVDNENDLEGPRSGKNIVTLHDAETGKRLRRLERQFDPAVVGNIQVQNKGDNSSKFLAYAADGRSLVAAGWDKAAYVWDVNTGKRLGPFGGAQHPAHCFALSPDGKILAAGGDDGRLRLYDLASAREVLQVPATGGRTHCLAFSADGKLLAAGGIIPERNAWFGQIDVWDVAAGKRVAFANDATVQAVAFSPDGKRLAAANADGTLKVWETRTGKPLTPDHGHRGMVLGVAFLPGGTVVSEAYDRTLRWWDLKTGKDLRRERAYPATIRGGIAVSPGGRLLAHAGAENTVVVRDAATGKEVKELRGHAALPHEAAFTADGTRLVTAERDGPAIVWDVKEGKEVLKFEHTFKHGECVAISPDGSLYAAVRQSFSGSNPGPHDMEVRDTATGKVRVSFQLAGDQPPARMAFTRDNKLLVAGTYGGNVWVFDAATGKERQRFRVSEMSVGGLAVSPDGKTVATNGYARHENGLALWDLTTGKRVGGGAPANGESVYALVFSPDGALLAAGGADTTVLLWDVARLRK